MATYIQVADSLPRWLGYLNSLLWNKGNLDDSGNRAFLRAASLGIEAQTAIDEVSRWIIDAGDRLRLAKLAGQCQDAYCHVGNAPGHAFRPSSIIQWPVVDWHALNWLAEHGPGIYDLWENSPFRWEDSESHTEEIIDLMFPGDPWLCIGFDNYNFATRRREAWRGILAHRGLIVPSPMIAT